MDLILEHEPWLNATTACTFPDPFYNASSFRAKKTKKFPSIPTYKTYPEHRLTTLARKRKGNCVGKYGNFFYGNLTVSQNDITEELLVQFDVYWCTLEPKQTNNSYSCLSPDEFWFLPPIPDLTFDADNNPARYVDVTLYDPAEGVFRFFRDLNQSEAPGPRDHWPKCD